MSKRIESVTTNNDYCYNLKIARNDFAVTERHGRELSNGCKQQLVGILLLITPPNDIAIDRQFARDIPSYIIPICHAVK